MSLRSPAEQPRLLLTISALAIAVVVLRLLFPDPAFGTPLPIERGIQAATSSFPTNAPGPLPAPAVDANDALPEQPTTF